MCKKCFPRLAEYTNEAVFIPDDYQHITSFNVDECKGRTNEHYEQFLTNCVNFNQDDDKIDEYKCVCGKKLFDLYFITHKSCSSKYYLIGSKCITDIFPKKSQVYKSAMFKKCTICSCSVLKSSFKIHCESKKHLDNLEHDKLHKKCEDCDAWIPRNFKSTCKSCYVLKKYNKRECASCGIHNINADSPYKNCYACTQKYKRYKK